MVLFLCKKEHKKFFCGTPTLDEFPEFEKRFLESLREPLEEKFVSISRAKGTEVFPANFILVAAMNPCPCGFKGNPFDGFDKLTAGKRKAGKDRVYLLGGRYLQIRAQTFGTDYEQN